MFSISASDQNNAFSAALIKIRYCYCVNGMCPDFMDLRSGFGSEDAFALAVCECDDGFDGL